MHVSLENLSQDHRTIERVLDVMQQAAHELLASRPVDPSLLRQSVACLSDLLDGCHWRKEEEFLFPALLTARSFVEDRLIEELRADHVRVRRALSEVRAAFSRLDAGHPGGGWAVAVALAACYAPLRMHLHAEEQAAFALAQQVLGVEKLDQLAVTFGQIDAAQEHPDQWRALYERVTVNAETAKPRI